MMTSIMKAKLMVAFMSRDSGDEVIAVLSAQQVRNIIKIGLSKATAAYTGSIPNTGKIAAIKYLRELTGLSLRDAKDILEDLIDNERRVQMFKAGLSIHTDLPEIAI